MKVPKSSTSQLRLKIFADNDLTVPPNLQRLRHLRLCRSWRYLVRFRHLFHVWGYWHTCVQEIFRQPKRHSPRWNYCQYARGFACWRTFLFFPCRPSVAPECHSDCCSCLDCGSNPAGGFQRCRSSLCRPSHRWLRHRCLLSHCPSLPGRDRSQGDPWACCFTPTGTISCFLSATALFLLIWQLLCDESHIWCIMLMRSNLVGHHMGHSDPVLHPVWMLFCRWRCQQPKPGHCCFQDSLGCPGHPRSDPIPRLLLLSSITTLAGL